MQTPSPHGRTALPHRPHVQELPADPSEFLGTSRDPNMPMDNPVEMARMLYQQPDLDPAERARELYKYFQPRDFEREHANGALLSEDITLTALAQLVTWRLGARRCLIAYFDEATQYIAAEATKTLDLEDTTRTDDPMDALWVGSGPPSPYPYNSMCLGTLRATTSEGSATFEVCEIKEDPLHGSLACVTGGPMFRYYLGSPLRTRSGIAIGTIYVVDEVSRAPATKEQKRFLQTIANNVVRHLELLREREERRRALRMNQYLSAFVNPLTDVGKSRVTARHRRGPSNSVSRKEPASRVPSLQRRSTSESEEEDPGSDVSEGSTTSTRVERSRKTVPRKQAGDDDEHNKVFRNAARLLRKALDLDDGGVVFCDSRADISSGIISSPQQGRRRSRISLRDQRRNSFSTASNVSVLAFSTTRNPTGKPGDLAEDFEDDDEEEFTAPSVDTIAEMIQRHGRGVLWDLDSAGITLFDSDGVDALTEVQKQAEVAVLRQHFPDATQVLALPVWEPRLSRWVVCFAYHASRYRFFSRDVDLLYSIAFNSCLTIELARLTAASSNKLKSDFISSISHELRSPLHGILASCEFLEDTTPSPFQQSLVHTVNSCARTLLDTISQVLDYSKINAFERDSKKATKSKKGASQPTANEDANRAPLNIYGNVDLAAITEEVVESTTAGSLYRDLSHVELSDVDARARGRTSSKGYGMMTKSFANAQNQPSTQHPGGPVEVILDIKARSSWTYITQPGAFRRIVMNLVGNALKYTSQGFIKISLATLPNDKNLQSADANGDRDNVPDLVVLTVTDSGKGISEDYLKNKLYTAFAQEDHLAVGTGLGLSMVSSLVKMLNGEIDVESVVGKGSTFSVQLPICRSGSGASSTNTTPSTASDQTKDDSVTAVQKLAHNKTLSIFRAQISGQKPAIELRGYDSNLLDRLAYYASDWCNLKVSDWTAASRSDVVVLTDSALPSYLSLTGNEHEKNLATSVLVLCSNTVRHSLLGAYSGVTGIGFMSKPFGPFKVARSLQSLLDKSHAHSDTDATLSQSAPTPILEEEVTLSTPRGDVNVVDAGSVIAKADSANADLALHVYSEPDHSTSSSDAQEYPFDSQVTPFTPFTDPEGFPATVEQVASPRLSLRPDLRNRRTMSPTVSELKGIEKALSNETNTLTHAGAMATTPEVPQLSTHLHVPPVQACPQSAPPIPEPRQPRVLLVDDNAINLRLLQTFMRKRKYPTVLSARDGIEAVSAFTTALDTQSGPAPPDIVFMDLSMPLMDGFEATRRIRALERSHAAYQDSHPSVRPASALIIALTGLASAKDQSEAFLAGVDLYMTKPVSFQEVGRLLDNWETNVGVREARGEAPHGPVTGMEWSASFTAKGDSENVRP